MNEAAGLMGVVLAAGKGARMLPFSESYPKPILPVGGRPLLVHQLETMAQLGIRDVVVVIGHLGHEVVRALGDGSRYGVRLKYVEQGETLGIAHAVSRLERHVDRPFFLFLGDIFFETENLGSMVQRLRDGAAGVLAVKTEPDPEAIRRNFIVMAGKDGRVTRVIEKPRHPRTNVKGCGIYLFDPAFFDAVRRTPRTALRDEYEITDSIQIFIDDGYRVDSADVIRADLNLSFPRDLLELNLYLLDKSGQRNQLGEGVRVHEGASLDRCVLMDGVVVETPVQLRNVLVFPHVVLHRARDYSNAILTPDMEIRCDDRAL
ncbi:MAG: NTP transferase domain-containing protein [Planctomycetes bacterium]|nr:NTP transferase domain-containing protein [Planctomycetota bacterium]